VINAVLAIDFFSEFEPFIRFVARHLFPTPRKIQAHFRHRNRRKLGDSFRTMDQGMRKERALTLKPARASSVFQFYTIPKLSE
jgi:hypothetical protein